MDRLQKEHPDLIGAPAYYAPRAEGGFDLWPVQLPAGAQCYKELPRLDADAATKDALIEDLWTAYKALRLNHAGARTTKAWHELTDLHDRVRAVLGREIR